MTPIEPTPPPPSQDANAPAEPTAIPAIKPRKRKRRWLWRILVLLVVLSSIFWIVLTRSFVTRQAILTLAGNKIGADLTASSVVIRLDGTVVMRDAIARAPGVAGEGGVLFSARRLEIDVDWGSMLDDVPRFRSVTLDSPLLRVSQDSADGSLNVDRIHVSTPSSPSNLGKPPSVTINRGVLELGEHSGESFTSLRRLDVEGTIRRSTIDLDQWLISISEIVEPGQNPLSLKGQIDSNGLAVSMDGMTMGEWSDANVPTRLRHTFRQLALQGRVGKTTFQFGSTGDIQATMQLEGMSLNLPVDTQPAEDMDGNKLPLPPEQVGRQLRMEGVKGTLTYADGFITGDFTGNLEELPYHVKLNYGGTSAIAPFTLELTCTGFELKKNPQIMRFAPGVAQRRFAQFSQPTGTVDATVTVRRAAPIDGKEADLNVVGDIVLHNGSASFERFPYLFEKMSGHWRFSEDELEIIQIQGEASSGARCFGYGRIAPLNDDAGADIQVEITDLPIDERLVDALGSKRKIVDALFNTEQYQKLLADGLVITPARHDELVARQKALDEGAAPTAPDEAAKIALELLHPQFAFGGKARVNVDVQREVGPEGIWLDTITIHLPNAGLVPEKFPFPLVAKDLTIVKLNDAATVTNGVLSGLMGGGAVISANVDLVKIEDPDLPFVPEITLKGSDVPVDALLIHAVPESLSGSETSPQRLLKELGVGGLIKHADVTIGMTPDNDVGYTVSLDVDRGTARPAPSRPGMPGPRVGARDLTGKVVLTQDSLAMDMKGEIYRLELPKVAEPVSFSAKIGFDEGADTTYTADIAADRFDVAFPVEDFVAPITKTSATKIIDLRSKYFPSGTIGATVHIQSAAPGTKGPDGLPADPAVRITATNPTIDFDYEAARVGIRDAKGKAIVEVGTPGRVAFEFVEGDLVLDAAAGGHVKIDGVTTFDLTPANATDTLTIRLEGGLFEAPLSRRVVEKVMSLGALEWYDRVKPHGLFNASVTLTPDPSKPDTSPDASPDAPTEPEWLVRGTIVPQTLAITTDKGPVPFSTVAGSVAFQTGGGALQEIHLHSPTWNLNADGTWTTLENGDTSVHIGLSGEAQSLAPTLMTLLPPEVSELAKDLSLGTPGAITLEDSTLAMILPADKPGVTANVRPVGTRFIGTIRTANASADLGVVLTDLDVAARVAYDSMEGEGTYDLRLLAESGKVEGVEISRARARVTGETGGSAFVPLFSADCHGGRIAGTASLSPTTDGRKSFVIDARVSDARFAPILANVEANRAAKGKVVLDEVTAAALPTVTADDALTPDGEATAAANDAASSPPDESRGRLDAEFALTGVVNDARSRRGRGTLIIGGERVINIPLLIPLIRITNLQLPVSERLDFASARFFLAGETINFEELEVSSRSVAIEGVGTTTLPNYDLDLRFRARSKTGIPLLSRLVDSIRNELVTGEVKGTIAEPDVNLRPFAGTRRIMDSAVGDGRGVPQRWLDELEAQPKNPVVKPARPQDVTPQ